AVDGQQNEDSEIGYHEIGIYIVVAVQVADVSGRIAATLRRAGQNVFGQIGPIKLSQRHRYQLHGASLAGSGISPRNSSFQARAVGRNRVSIRLDLIEEESPNVIRSRLVLSARGPSNSGYSQARQAVPASRVDNAAPDDRSRLAIDRC